MLGFFYPGLIFRRIWFLWFKNNIGLFIFSFSLQIHAKVWRTLQWTCTRPGLSSTSRGPSDVFYTCKIDDQKYYTLTRSLYYVRDHLKSLRLNATESTFKMSKKVHIRHVYEIIWIKKMSRQLICYWNFKKILFFII